MKFTLHLAATLLMVGSSGYSSDPYNANLTRIDHTADTGSPETTTELIDQLCDLWVRNAELIQKLVNLNEEEVVLLREKCALEKNAAIQLLQNGYMRFINDLLIVTKAIFLEEMNYKISTMGKTVSPEESNYHARQEKNLSQLQQLVRQEALSVENGTDSPQQG